MGKHDSNTKKLAVRWADIDSFNHVSNNTFFSYFDEARLEWLRHLELGHTARDIGPAVIETSCKYLKQLSYPATIIIRTEVIDVGKTNFTCKHEVFSEDGTTKYAEGMAKIAWIDYKKQKICKLPEELFDYLLKNES